METPRADIKSVSVPRGPTKASKIAKDLKDVEGKKGQNVRRNLMPEFDKDDMPGLMTDSDED